MKEDFIKKILITTLLSATFLLSIAVKAEDKVFATYNGIPVKESQIMEQYKQILDMQPAYKNKKFSEFDRPFQEGLLRDFINTKLLEQEAINQKIEFTKEFEEKLANVKKQLLQQEIIDRQIKKELNDNLIDEEYKKLVESLKGKEEAKVAHILVDTEAKAKEVKKQLDEGAKFAVLAKKYSKDEDSKNRGGEIGYFMQGQMVPEFGKKAFSMKNNEISDPVKTQFGWHIIKLLIKRLVKIPTKEEAKQSITMKLSREIIMNYLSELSDKAKVELKLPEPEKKDEKPSVPTEPTEKEKK